MRLTHAFLVIVDISGYTSFITQRTVSLQHAEQIITELMETVIDRADHPLVVNKLEGDAALLFCECAVGDSDAARDVFAQVKAFFPAFYACRDKQREQRSNCNCDACSNIDLLKLKAFVHVGEFAVKQVRQFEELAGENVILVHRLLKNHVPSREYVLITEAARAAAEIPVGALQSHRESFEGIGELALWLSAPDALPFELPVRRTAASSQPMDIGSSAVAVERDAVFHHLPVIAPEPAPSLMRRLQTWLGRG
jgi:hypothetical protein